MVRNKKGFTLIELLAVIIVLAIIALIATPIVTKTIASSKKSVAIESANNLIRSAELYFITANPKYGRLDVLDENLSYSGTKPETGEVEINSKGKSRIYAYINGYCVTKEYEGETYATKMNKEVCSWYATDNYETTEGTTFTLNNQNIKDYKIYGNSTQDVRSGKNLLDGSLWSTATTQNGITIKYLEDEDCFLINGTATQQMDYALKFMNIPNTPNTAYSISTKYISGTIDKTNAEGGKYSLVYFGKNDSLNTKSNWTSLTLKTEDDINNNRVNDKNYISSMWFYISAGVSFDNYKVRIQLEKGTEATSYEQYGAMPSIENPSEITNVGDLITSSNCSNYGSDACDNIGKYVIPVKASGKNLVDISDFQLTQTNSYYASNFITDINILNSINEGLKKGAISFSFDIEGENIESFSKEIVIEYINTAGSRKSVTLNADIQGITNITIEDYQSIGTSFSIRARSNSSELNGTVIKFSNIQIEEGSEATSYEPYMEPEVTNIYLDEPLRKVGDTVDYIDFENKAIVRNVGEYSFKGTESFNVSGNTTTESLVCFTDSIIPEPKISGANGLCNIGNVGSLTEIKNYSNGFFYNVNHNHFLKIPKSVISGYDDDLTNTEKVTLFKTYLANLYSAGTPVKILYELTTQDNTETINLPSINLIEGYNKITIDTNVQPSNMVLTTDK